MTTHTSALRPGIEERLNVMEASAAALKSHGLIHRVAEDARLDGRRISVDGRALVNFGSCSYLGLETDARLKTAACEALLRFGTQFSSSRAYVSLPLYAEFEALLSELVGGYPVVVSQTTSLGHLAALPVLVGANDAVLFDVQVHSSLQAVLPTLRMAGVPCEAVPHNRLDRLEERARALAERHARVFYLCDGVYSMHGDAVDVNGLCGVLDRIPNLHAYVDDAHGVGWSGARGSGHVLGAGPLHPRMMVILGLSKSFGAAGAALVFPTRELAERVFTCGSTLIFSGPLQPAQLGAGVASARIHLSPELEQLQAGLRQRIQCFDACATEQKLRTRSQIQTPIRFVEVGSEEVAMNWGGALKRAGFFTNVAVYPAVPRRRAGIRLMLNLNQTLDDVRGVVHELGRLTSKASSTIQAAPALT
ncbi:MAG TPA: aminotransferase class I/II-fold pyridoxal phosphate-dependent enzyme [Polyangiaceae bacterium]|nr:aminotransferase class I/II-fold pyridoxal phosphate-dependent enzyme [Polyangiaceae bacterium]